LGRPGAHGGDRRHGHRHPASGEPLSAGRFIALEGVDGSGKTTQALNLARALRERGLDVVATREPGGTGLGDRLRELLLDPASPPASAAAEALLFAAARAELVAEVIRPALERGAWVVSDRFVDSSLAYQGAARGLGVDLVWRLNEAAVSGFLPDLSLVLDVPVATAWARGRSADDRIEDEGIALQERVAAGYRELADRFPERVRLVPADGSPEKVAAAILGAVEALA
jgi:dTMP kinase